jgi:hypothetical protein
LCCICDEALNQHFDFFPSNNQNPINPNSKNNNILINTNNNSASNSISATENANLQSAFGTMNPSGSHIDQSVDRLTPPKTQNEIEHDVTINNLLISKSNKASSDRANENLIPSKHVNSEDLFSNVNKNDLIYLHKKNNINNFNDNKYNNNNFNSHYNNNINIKIKEFSLPKEIISELENPNLCVICFDSDISRDPAVKFQCSHVFCLICVKNYLEKNIENGKVNTILIRVIRFLT